MHSGFLTPWQPPASLGFRADETESATPLSFTFVAEVPHKHGRMVAIATNEISHVLHVHSVVVEHAVFIHNKYAQTIVYVQHSGLRRVVTHPSAIPADGAQLLRAVELDAIRNRHPHPTKVVVVAEATDL